MDTFEDPDEGYNPNYTRAPGVLKMKSYIRIYTL